MAAFDPYRDWLDIQDYRRPPDHYVLLGLPRYEQDLDKIRRSADTRKSRVRSIRPGPHVAEWQKLLDEIEAARGCLLSETDKQVYDRQLREQPTEDESVFETRADEDASTAASSLIADSEESHLGRARESEVKQQGPATKQPVTNPLPPPLDKVPADVGPTEPPETTPVESWTKNLLPPSLDTPSQATADPAAGMAPQVSSTRSANAGPTAVPATADSRSETVSSPPDTAAAASPPGKLLMPPGLSAVAGAEGSGVAADTKTEQKRPGLTLPRASGEAGPTLTSSLSLDQLLPPMAQPAVPANSPHASSVPTAVPVAKPVAVVAAAPKTATLEPQISEPDSSSATLFPATLASWKNRWPKNNLLMNLAVVVGIGVLAYAAYAVMRNGSVDREQGGSIEQVALKSKEESQNQENGPSGNDQPDQGGAAGDVGSGNSARDEPEIQNQSSPDMSMPPEESVSEENGPTAVDPGPEEDWTPGAALNPPGGNIRPEEGDMEPQQKPDSIDPQPTTFEATEPEPTEPAPPEPTEPEPSEPAEPEPPELTEAQLSELAAALEEVKHSLTTRDLVSASRSRDRAEAIAVEAPGPHADKVHRMSLLCDYVHEFWDAVRAGMAAVNGQDVKVGNTVIHVVVANERGIVYRHSGKNYRHAFYKMPAGLARLIAEQWLEKTPTSRIFVGAFMAVEPKYGPKKAREEWEAALQGGAPVEELIPILDEL